VKVNALQVRQKFGEILKRLEKSDEPIVIEKGRKSVAVLISLKTFQERFIDYREQKKRDELLEAFRTSAPKSRIDSLTTIRELRYGSDH
jgi:PHD/YefM family antitoxin component YafN of YafNO toxin-antitoxin module